MVAQAAARLGRGRAGPRRWERRRDGRLPDRAGRGGARHRHGAHRRQARPRAGSSVWRTASWSRRGVRRRRSSRAPEDAASTWSSSSSAARTSPRTWSASRRAGASSSSGRWRGTSVELDLGRLMHKRAEIRGTVLRARPLEEKIVAARALERNLVPLFESGRYARSSTACFPWRRRRTRTARCRTTKRSGR